jgi:putative spermidine/putrescine transport system substrate-binding protein
MDAALNEYLPTQYADQQVSLNFQYWAEHGQEIAQRWNDWQLK